MPLSKSGQAQYTAEQSQYLKAINPTRNYLGPPATVSGSQPTPSLSLQAIQAAEAAADWMESIPFLKLDFSQPENAAYLAALGLIGV